MGDIESATSVAECSRRLVARVEHALRPERLDGLASLRDAPGCKVSGQVQLSLLRHCVDNTLVYFLRTMPAVMTVDAARLHDARVEASLRTVLAAHACPARQWADACAQARLPVKLGGLGLTAMGVYGVSPSKVRGFSLTMIFRPYSTLYLTHIARNIRRYQP